MPKPTSIPELIDAFGGATKFSEIMSIKPNKPMKPSTASEMKRRASIRALYWPRIIAAAAKYGIEGVSSETLMKMHSE
jgi:hypothetical protein